MRTPPTRTCIWILTSLDLVTHEQRVCRAYDDEQRAHEDRDLIAASLDPEHPEKWTIWPVFLFSAKGPKA